jgi:hypothetical protein
LRGRRYSLDTVLANSHNGEPFHATRPDAR